MPLRYGGILGLRKDEDKFCRWQICSPKIARAVSQFEDLTVLKENEYSDFHHMKVLSPFKKHLQSMCLLLQKNLTS